MSHFRTSHFLANNYSNKGYSYSTDKNHHVWLFPCHKVVATWSVNTLLIVPGFYGVFFRQAFSHHGKNNLPTSFMLEPRKAKARSIDPPAIYSEFRRWNYPFMEKSISIIECLVMIWTRHMRPWIAVVSLFEFCFLITPVYQLLEFVQIICTHNICFRWPSDYLWLPMVLTNILICISDRWLIYSRYASSRKAAGTVRHSTRLSVQCWLRRGRRRRVLCRS